MTGSHIKELQINAAHEERVLLSRSFQDLGIIIMKQMTVAELAEDAFLKAEHVKALSMMNTPTDFEARKKAFVALAVAREAANKAQAELDKILR